MNKNIKKLASLVLIAFASTIILFAPRYGAAGNQPNSETISGGSLMVGVRCLRGSSAFDRRCAFVGGSTIHQPLGASFDYLNGSPQSTMLQLYRISFSGSVSVDSKTLNGSSGQVDAWVPAINTATNPSPYDYWSGVEQNVDNFIGMTLYWY